MPTMKRAPIALFAYNRPRHLKRTAEALARNELARESDLFVFCDGAGRGALDARVREAREYARSITGFRAVTLIERDHNLGLAESIITGVTEVVNKHGRVIVLEDDMVTSPFFLRYMNDALEFYRDEERVISIHGYRYPLRASLPETFFLRGADCWGWATWKRGWDLFERDGRKLLKELKRRKLEKRFDLGGSHPYTRMLRWQAWGALDSWAIRWHASAFLAGKLTLYPGVSLVSNIGLDASGTHCSPTGRFDITLAGNAVKVGPVPLEEHEGAKQALESYYRATRSPLLKSALVKLIRRIRG